MRFVCQISYPGIPVTRTNIVPKNEYDKYHIQEMDFWGGGELFVFFEPETKIACYIVQNT